MRFEKGCKPWNTGKKRPPFSVEWRRKLGNASRGRHQSLEAKKKVSEARKGKSRDEKTRQKISETLKMKYANGWTLWKGRHHTLNTRHKMSEIKKGNQLWKGRHHTEKSKEKIRLARRHQVFPTEDTGIERLLQIELTRRHIPFVTHLAEVGQPDIAFPQQKIVVFADGDHWHGEKFPQNQARDKRINTQLRELGWTILRYWGSEINANCAGCVDEIEDVWMRKGGQ